MDGGSASSPDKPLLTNFLKASGKALVAVLETQLVAAEAERLQALCLCRHQLRLEHCDQRLPARLQKVREQRLVRR